MKFTDSPCIDFHSPPTHEASHLPVLIRSGNERNEFADRCGFPITTKPGRAAYESEPLMTHRKELGDIKTGSANLSQEKHGGSPLIGYVVSGEIDELTNAADCRRHVGRPIIAASSRAIGMPFEYPSAFR
jgi:hypothetical protein